MASITEFDHVTQSGRAARRSQRAKRAAGTWRAVRALGQRLQRFMDRRIDRMALARLEQLDERTLRDIGVTRDEVAEAMAMPIDEDAHGALDAKRQARLKKRSAW